jgi:hypothetical protein
MAPVGVEPAVLNDGFGVFDEIAERAVAFIGCRTWAANGGPTA